MGDDQTTWVDDFNDDKHKFIPVNDDNPHLPLNAFAKTKDGLYSAYARWDGCVELYKYNPEMDDTDNLHICDLENHIKMLQNLLTHMQETLGHHDAWS